MELIAPLRRPLVSPERAFVADGKSNDSPKAASGREFQWKCRGSLQSAVREEVHNRSHSLKNKTKQKQPVVGQSKRTGALELAFHRPADGTAYASWAHRKTARDGRRPALTRAGRGFAGFGPRA